MGIELSPWNSAEILDTPEAVAAYIEAALEENDPVIFAHALGVAARAGGLADIAAKAGLDADQLAHALAETGDPKISAVMRVMKALGLTLGVRVTEAQAL
jgi:probable addiction module antidote protein